MQDENQIAEAILALRESLRTDHPLMGIGAQDLPDHNDALYAIASAIETLAEAVRDASRT